MADRKHISCTEDAYERNAALKQEDESWSEYLERAADAIEARKTDSGQDRNAEETLTPEHIDDIAGQVARATADEVENRLTRR